jgi:hypothetical protein
MLNLIELTSLYQLLFILKILFTFFSKQASLAGRSTVLSLSLQLEVYGLDQATLTKGEGSVWLLY